MKAEDILAGPIVRRADKTMVTIWIATTKPFELMTAIRPVSDDPTWTGVSDSYAMRVCENLWVHLMVVAPMKGSFPLGKLLEYSIAVVDADGNENHDYFEAIVLSDGLAYADFKLPNLYLQDPRSKLNALYCSCRKPHDRNGGGHDALAHGDDLISNGGVDVLATRPAVLCMIGDQIYADDVAGETFDAMVALAKSLEGSAVETLPGGLTLPGKGQRLKFVQNWASYTSDYAENHVVTFAEFAAMYGLVWNPRMWPRRGSRGDVLEFVVTLNKVRRLMANTPTYMIFDDHDVTDDWNLSLQWFGQVNSTKLGPRLLTNALFAFWLFQGWGNDPMREKPILVEMQKANKQRLEAPQYLEALLSKKSVENGWEFFAPTYPAIYFLDTRTQRGHFDGFARTQTKAPPFLKSVSSWTATLLRMQKLVNAQNKNTPLILVATAPIFGFKEIDTLQFMAGRVLGPLPYDEEGWAANRAHLMTFLLLCADLDLVILSGDVHYSFTCTARFDVFDSDFLRSVQAAFPSCKFPKTGSGSSATYEHLYSARFLQLNSSAAKNFAHDVLGEASKRALANSHLVKDKQRNGNTHDVWEGDHKDGNVTFKVFVPVAGWLPLTEPAKVFRPLCAFHQKINNSAIHSPYLGSHNIGLLQVTGRKVVNSFLVGRKQVSLRTFDFANKSLWTT